VKKALLLLVLLATGCAAAGCRDQTSAPAQPDTTKYGAAGRDGANIDGGIGGRGGQSGSGPGGGQGGPGGAGIGGGRGGAGGAGGSGQ